MDEKMAKRQSPAFVMPILALIIASFTYGGRAFGATESVLWSFAGGPDGSVPVSPLTMDPNGNLFGTTSAGERTVGALFSN